MFPFDCCTSADLYREMQAMRKEMSDGFVFLANALGELKESQRVTDAAAVSAAEAMMARAAQVRRQTD